MTINQKIKKIHFIGIGGIGVSALVKYYLAKGFLVSGSDVCQSEITEELKKMGAEIFTPTLSQKCQVFSDNKISGHRKENLPPDADLVIYSAAVGPDNPELVEARKRKIKCQTYAQALGELTKKMWTIAVSGTHGKSTTTAMLALILIEAGLDPTVIIGTKVNWGNTKNQNSFPSSLKKGKKSFSLKKTNQGAVSNFRLGKSKYLVIEADEYNASFLNYWPKMIVLTNIEADHLDYYKNLKNILKTFKSYIGHLDRSETLVANGQDRRILKITKGLKCKIIYYFLNSAGQQAGQIKKFVAKNSQIFYAAAPALMVNKKSGLLGQHNLMNAFAAISAARALGISDKVSIKALNNFPGTWRRMEYKGKINGAAIFDDYAHHPTEIKATLQGAREYLACYNKKRLASKQEERRGGVNKQQPLIFSRGAAWSQSSKKQKTKRRIGGRLWCVFQPHQYQRTYQLFNEFVGAFDMADKVILLPIYSVAGREKESIKKKVSSEKLAEAIKKRKLKFKNSKIALRQIAKRKTQIVKNQGADKVLYFDSFDKTVKYLRKNLRDGDLAIIMGAGNIYKLTEQLI